MSTDPRKKSLSEISHLFLSSVRERQGDGAARPRRTPPPADVSIDLTPEEFANVYGSPSEPAEPLRDAVPVTALVAAHLNGKQFDWAKKYARHLAATEGRVGLIELDASELRLVCFDPSAPASPDDAAEARIASRTDFPDARQMTEALEELNCDVARWLVLLPNPRTPEARAVLRLIPHWTVLSTCDHDGVVSSYRMLKGLSSDPRPGLSLCLLDATDEDQAANVFQKLAGVCTQFLNWPIEPEPALEPTDAVGEHLALLYRPTRDKAQLAAAPQWDVVSQFLSAATANGHESQPQEHSGEEAMLKELSAEEPVQFKPAVQETPAAAAAPIPLRAPLASEPKAEPAGFDDVIDLPGFDASGQSILSAVMGRSALQMVECPVRPPMCVEARLAVGRDRSLVLVAVATKGLAELKSIGHAYRWLNENRELIAMALPQMSVDPHQPPRLRLLVDRADFTADALQPMLQSGHVAVQAYRKLRWGERLGFYLEAA